MTQKPNYGIDAPAIIKKYTIFGLMNILAGILISIYTPQHWWWIVLTIGFYISSLFCFFPVLTILWGSLFFKFRERDWLFQNLPLSGDEKVLDLGCGHGLLSIAAAKKLTTGKVYSLDLWIQADQAFNSSEATQKNIDLENVSHKIEIHNGDMRQIPFANESFDVIVSSWAIHNLRKKEDRDSVLMEIKRVLKPGGRVAILDIEFAPTYANFFFTHGFSEVQRLGPRRTFGNKTYLVISTK